MGEEEESISDDILQAHMDPFYSECRAYGRLEEANLNGKVAVRCQGYMTFPAEDEEELVRVCRFSSRTRGVTWLYQHAYTTNILTLCCLFKSIGPTLNVCRYELPKFILIQVWCRKICERRSGSNGSIAFSLILSFTLNPK